MKTNNCGKCQYFRKPLIAGMMTESTWCSNSKSDAVLGYVAETYHCGEFVKRRKKAPLWMRLLNRVTR